MSLIIGANSASSGSVPLEVTNSVRCDGTSSYFYRTPGSSGSATTATMSAWVKRCLPGTATMVFGGQTGTDVNNRTKFGIDGTDQLVCQIINGGVVDEWKTTQLLIDASSWYHLVFVWDTSNATPGDRIKFYINGVRVTDFDTQDAIPLNAELKMSTTSDTIYVGARKTTSTINQWFNGYMSEVVFIDGTALEATDFGMFNEDTNIWVPIEVENLTFGTNGFYLDMKDSAALGDDESGNTNDLTVSGLVALDQCTDVPTNNFATFNVLHKPSNSVPQWFNGNTYMTVTSGGDWMTALGTFGAKAGKWYWEYRWTQGTGPRMMGAMSENGLVPDSTGISFYIGNSGQYQGVCQSNTSGGRRYPGSGGSSALGGTAVAIGDVGAIALDLDNQAIYAAKNNTWMYSGVPTSGASRTGVLYNIVVDGELWFPGLGIYEGTAPDDCYINFGQPSISFGTNADANSYGRFAYTPPTGYYAWCTKNLKDYG